MRKAAALTLSVAIGLPWLLAASPSAATDRALLIGVADYPNLPRRLWLRAPGNDVALMRDTLMARGFAPGDIEQLVSRAGGEREPTRANIIGAMQTLLQRTARGDHLVLYFAGHGSQQPQPAQHGNRPVEPDGLDEVFLPADVRRWDGTGSDAVIPNALLDDEIGEWIDAVVDRGATVWAIFDTCHAAGMARGGKSSQTAQRTRAVPAAELGLPTPPASRRESSKLLPVATPHPRTDGRVLAFAARVHESTGEEWLPRGAPMQQGRLHGVFTFHLAAQIARPAQSTLAALQRALREVYERDGRTAPTPAFQGDSATRLN